MQNDEYVIRAPEVSSLSSAPDDAVEWPLTQLRKRADHSSIPIARRGAAVLPLSSLEPEIFERLIAELVATRDDSSVHFYGRRGQKQYGLDIYEEQSDGTRVLYQVKRFQSMRPESIQQVVADWAGLPRRWHSTTTTPRRFEAARFILVTSALIDDDTAKLDELAAVQQAYQGDVRVDVWGAEALSARLRSAPGIVVSFFGEAWADEFCGRQATREALKEGKRLRDAEDCLVRAVGAQYASDDNIKFRQIDLVGITVERLFVDVPVRANPGSSVESLLREINSPTFRSSTDHSTAGAVQTLLHPAWTRSVVVVGGPGQGKSTLLQYLCQYHRARLLGYDGYVPDDLGLAEIADLVRTPLKVELTKYAEWRREWVETMRADRQRRKGRRSVPPTIEHYLAELVANLGAGQFGRRGLEHAIKTRPLLLALDGLDEIADETEREQVADDIRATEGRLRSLRADAIILVATRPGTVGNPIWRDNTFATLFLQRLTPALRMTYLERWLKTVNLEADEVQDLRVAFEHGLSRPHISELAGNPMQLAILLHLMHKVPSLPEKRTKLYELYIEIFMQRESKHAIIRDNLDLVMAFHRLLAWYIHANVELRRSTGAVSYEELRTVLAAYLTPRGVAPGVIDEIFGSFTQRVLCLSEVKTGSREYQFDVQPLREYFASAYIYEVAPDNAPENIQQAILRALLPRQYWENVLRFFAGELRSGEIANIGYALDALASDHLLGPHPVRRVLARLLLEDQVFAGQHEVVVRDIVTKVLEGPGLWLALDGLLQQDDQLLHFPPGAALSAANAALVQFALDPQRSVAVPAAALLRTLGLAEQFPIQDLAAVTLSPRDHLQRLVALGALNRSTQSIEDAVDQLAVGLSPDDAVLSFMLAEDVRVGTPALLDHCHRELATGRVPSVIGTHVNFASPLVRLTNAASCEHLYARLSGALGGGNEPEREPRARRRRRTRRGQPPSHLGLVERVERVERVVGNWKTVDPWRVSLAGIEDAWGVGAWQVREAVLTIPSTMLLELATEPGSIARGASWQQIAVWRRTAMENRADVEWWEAAAGECVDGVAHASFVTYCLIAARSEAVRTLLPTLEGLLKETGTVGLGTIATTLARNALRDPARSILRLTDALRRNLIAPTSSLSALIWQVCDEPTRAHLGRLIMEDPAPLWGGSRDTVNAALDAFTVDDRRISWKKLEGSRAAISGGLLTSARLSAMNRRDAQQILLNPEPWPTDVVRAAADRLSRDLSELAPIASVAREEDWTGPDGDLLNISISRHDTKKDPASARAANDSQT